MYNDNHIGLCFIGSKNLYATDMDKKAFQVWLYETIYRLVDTHYCTRFLFETIKDFEVACIKTILGEVLTDNKITRKILPREGCVDLLLLVSENGTVDHDIETEKMKIDDILTTPLKVPLSISPYTVPGDHRSKIYEMIDLSNFMVCCLSNDNADEDRFYLEYAKSAGVEVKNWLD